MNPAQTGTKAAAHYDLKVPAGKSVTVRLRLTKAGAERKASFADFSSTMELRRKELTISIVWSCRSMSPMTKSW